MNWKKVKDEIPADEMDLLFIDINGEVYKGYLSFLPYSDEYEFLDEYLREVKDVVYWMYLKDLPLPSNLTITNDAIITIDDWVTALAKKGFFK